MQESGKWQKYKYAVAAIIVILIFTSVLLSYVAFNLTRKTQKEVLVQGTVSTAYEFYSNPLYFINSNGTIEKSVPTTNGHYSVLLPGGQTYFVNNYAHTEAPNLSSQFQPFYVPLGVKNFTENLMPIQPAPTPVPLYDVKFSVLNPQVTEVSGWIGFYNNIPQGLSLEVNMTFTSTTDQPIIIPIENLSVSYYNSTVNLHSWINGNGNYSSIQQQAFNYLFSLNQVALQPSMSSSTLLTINLAKNAPIGQYSLQIFLGKVENINSNENSIISYSGMVGLELIVIPAT